MCVVQIYVGRHWSFFLWTLNLFLAEPRPSLLVAAWCGRRRWQNKGVKEVLVCFLGAAGPSPSDLLQHSGDRATVSVKALCAVGFCFTAYAGVQLKKRRTGIFLRKNVLQKSIIYVISKAGAFKHLFASVSYVQKSHWSSRFPERILTVGKTL